MAWGFAGEDASGTMPADAGGTWKDVSFAVDMRWVQTNGAEWRDAVTRVVPRRPVQGRARRVRCAARARCLRRGSCRAGRRAIEAMLAEWCDSGAAYADFGAEVLRAANAQR